MPNPQAAQCNRVNISLSSASVLAINTVIRISQVRYQSPSNLESAFKLKAFNGQTHENLGHDVEKVRRQ